MATIYGGEKLYNQKLYDAVFGFVIGDALGVPYEFRKRGSFLCQDMIGYGTHEQPAGTWSDDTAMTLATLRSLKKNKNKIVLEDIRERFLRWLNDGDFSADGEIFDVGHATLKALATGIPRSGEYDNGNGSLMRILPLAFVDCTDEEIKAVSAITHGHWISQEACVIYVHVIRRLLTGETIDGIIPTLQYVRPFDRLCKINTLPEEQIKSSGFVVDTLEAALWSVNQTVEAGKNGGRKENAFASSVLRAINLGEDTDTIGAVAGGLAGVMFGLGNQGERWLNMLRNKELILDCLW